MSAPPRVQPTRFQAVKGTRDLLPPETGVWAAVEATARRVFAAYGYGEIRTPLLEETELFVRGVGEASDIVGKQMYTFSDKKGRSMTLRPESTAAVARAYVERGLKDWPPPVKLFYIGPHFRYERPQKGRYRQFHQIGAELIGDPGPLADAELLLMLLRFLGELGFSGLTVLLNTLGDESSRAAYRGALRDYFEPHRGELAEDSRRRLDDNPLRILDSKAQGDRDLVAAAPRLDELLSPASREHLAALRGLLDRAGVAYRVEPRLVRGLDYYTETVFEITAAGLGAQDAIVGGGRYDGLIAALGGPAVPAIGFAIGEDRLIDALPAQSRGRLTPPAPVAVIPIGGAAAAGALAVAETLRDAALTVELELASRSVKAALKRADRAGARLAVLLGENEMARGSATVRDLREGRQQSVRIDELAACLAGLATTGSGRPRASDEETAGLPIEPPGAAEEGT